MSDDILNSAKKRERRSHADRGSRGKGRVLHTTWSYFENWPRCIDLQCSSPPRLVYRLSPLERRSEIEFLDQKMKKIFYNILKQKFYGSHYRYLITYCDATYIYTLRKRVSFNKYLVEYCQLNIYLYSK